MKKPIKKKNPVKVAQGKKLQDNLKKEHQAELVKQIKPILDKFNMRIKSLENQPRIIERNVVNNRGSTFSFNPTFKASLFDSILKTKFFPIEINKKEKEINIKEILKRIWSRLDQQLVFINKNKNENQELKSKIKILEANQLKLEKRLKKLENGNRS